MKKKIGRITAISLCVIMMLGIAPLNGLPEIDLSDFPSMFITAAKAAKTAKAARRSMNRIIRRGASLPETMRTAA